MCFYPRQGLRSTSVFTKNGKNPLKFIPKIAEAFFKGNPNLVTGIPCGKCTDCRLKVSGFWATRMVHEAQLHKENCFITLTFDEEKLNARANPKSLDHREFQLFFKRLRKRFKGRSIRYYMCGEYGELTGRPHYHACIFGLDFHDKKLYKVNNGNSLYTSEVLSDLWPYGYSTVASFTFDTAAYCSRYILKKQYGPDSWKHYFDYVDEETGELIGLRIPEYTKMSRRSGIGKEWLVKYFADIYKGDKSRVFMRGKGFLPVPKYYDSQYENMNPLHYSAIKQARIQEAIKRADPDPQRRLHAKKIISDSRTKLLKRGL